MKHDTVVQPILYSFRRCPYAMRARMALRLADIEVEHREILLKNKPPSMLAASPKGTVPVLVCADGRVIDESWELMKWALSEHDPEGLIGKDNRWLERSHSLVKECDGPFKQALDSYKYADRHPQPAETYRDQAMSFLQSLEQRLAMQAFLLSNQLSIADIAVMPFIRQFAQVDREWFSSACLPRLDLWLSKFLKSSLFQSIMVKHPLWEFENCDDSRNAKC